jgi:hypothetical protein
MRFNVGRALVIDNHPASQNDRNRCSITSWRSSTGVLGYAVRSTTSDLLLLVTKHQGQVDFGSGSGQ